MHPRIKLATQTNHQLNGFVFSCPRTRLKKGLVNRGAELLVWCLMTWTNPCAIDWPGEFGMNNQQSPKPREFRHSFAQVFFGYIREFIHSGRHQETFEADHSGMMQSCQLACVSRDNTAPESSIDVAITVGSV